MAFDLGKLLEGVSDPGMKRDEIVYLRLDIIDDDKANFYSLDGIDELANNIATIGLLDPLRVRRDEDRYKVVSGHRRRLALRLLAKENPAQWVEVPTIIDQDEISPALQELRLIFANADTRKMTDADISQQAVKVEELLYRLKEEEGYEFPGRMRDHVAKIVGVSKSKLARLKVIREKLVFNWCASFKDGKLGESVAYALAQLPAYWQHMIFSQCRDVNYLYEGTVQEYARRFKAIDETRCGPKKDMVCGHKSTMMEKSCKDRYSDPCRSRCCWECSCLRTCKDSCSAAAGKKKDLRENHKAEVASEAQRVADRDRPKVEKVSALWQRFGLARELACKDWPDCKNAMDLSYHPFDDEKVMQLECGEAKVTPDMKLPYSATRYDVNQLSTLADYLGCSIDYLFCRTDVRKMAQEAVSESGTGWRTGNPEAYGTYVAYVQITGSQKKSLRELLWDGEEWFLFGNSIADNAKVCCWMERPEEM